MLVGKGIYAHIVRADPLQRGPLHYRQVSIPVWLGPCMMTVHRPTVGSLCLMAFDLVQQILGFRGLSHLAVSSEPVDLPLLMLAEVL